MFSNEMLAVGSVLSGVVAAVALVDAGRRSILPKKTVGDLLSVGVGVVLGALLVVIGSAKLEETRLEAGTSKYASHDMLYSGRTHVLTTRIAE